MKRDQHRTFVIDERMGKGRKRGTDTSASDESGAKTTVTALWSARRATRRAAGSAVGVGAWTGGRGIVVRILIGRRIGLVMLRGVALSNRRGMISSLRILFVEDDG